MPKLPPPPRMAQNRSGFSVALASQQLSVGSDDVDRSQLIAGQAEAARHAPESAAQRQAAGAGMRDRAGGRDEAKWQRLAIEIAEERSAAGAREPLARIDAHAAHQGQVDHEPVVAHRLAREAVAAAAHGHEQLVRAREVHGAHDVRGAQAAGDHRGTTIEHAVEDLARVLVPGDVRQQQLAAQPGAEVLHVGGAQQDLLAVAGNRRDVGGDGRDGCERTPERECRGADRSRGGSTESSSLHGSSDGATLRESGWRAIRTASTGAVTIARTPLPR